MAGIGVSAAAAHRSGGNLAATAGLFLLIHAGVVIAIASFGGKRGGPSSVLHGAAGSLIIGTALFAGDLAIAGLLDAHPFPLAAPAGGMVLLLGWVLVIIGGAWAALRGD